MKLNSSNLKFIAMLTMLIDHVGAVLFPSLIVLRVIGRIAFVIFAFELVEGFFHTSSIGKYILRLLIFGIVSEVFFDMAFFGRLFDMSHQNVMFELALGLMLLWALEFNKEYHPILRWIMSIISMLMVMLVAEIFRFDYGSYGIMMMLVFYFSRNSRFAMLIQGVLLLVINAYIMPQYLINIYGVQVPIQGFAILSLIFIALYNGEKGKLNKYVAYAFYPGHLLILAIINMFY